MVSDDENNKNKKNNDTDVATFAADNDAISSSSKLKRKTHTVKIASPPKRIKTGEK